MPLSIVSVSGSLRATSTTTALLERIVDGFAAHREVSRHLVELAPLAVDLATAVTGQERTAALADELERVGEADLLVVATPVYRGSYTGLFKQFFDLVHQDALAGMPVLLAAAGGNDLHSLVIDHELRPLFAFFKALTLPVGVYARGSDFTDGVVTEPKLEAAIAAAVEASLVSLR